MKLFVWKELDTVSKCYHEGGGLMIVARDLYHATQLAHDKDAHDCAPRIDAEPDHIFDIDAQSEPMVIAFPDAGCC